MFKQGQQIIISAMFKLLLILLFLVINSDSKCQNKFDYILCDSLEDVKTTENRNKWSELFVKNYEEQHKRGTIEADVFKQMPQVTKLNFDNSVNDIEAHAFASLSFLTNLVLRNCDLPVIRKNWFSNSTLVEVEIFGGKVTALEARCFDGLELLTLEGNNISRIIENVFNSTSIETLDFENSGVRFIDENAFANMTKLNSLSLAKNLLTSFNSKKMAGNRKNPTLKWLFLTNNQIKYLDEDSFIVFPNIKRIYLQSNDLDSIREETFAGLDKLELLDLSFNKLKTIPERAISYEGLPNLEVLHLHRNRFNYWPRLFVRNFPKLVVISVFENPWQCRCYKEMMHTLLVHHKKVKISCFEKFAKGERPVCVVPQTHSDACRENIQNYEDLSRNFEERLNEYPSVNC